MDYNERLNLCQVEISGDRFLLTVPTASIWDDFLQYCAWSTKAQETCDVLNHCCVYEIIGERIDILNSMYYADDSDGVGDHNRVVAYIHDGLLCGKDLDKPTFYFRPMLVPLNNQGKFDNFMMASNGELVDGGIFLVEKRNDNLAYPVYIGQVDKVRAVEYQVNLDQLTVTLLDSGDPDKLKSRFNMMPLKWLVCDGCLVATQAVIKMSIQDMINWKVLPNPQD